MMHTIHDLGTGKAGKEAVNVHGTQMTSKAFEKCIRNTKTHVVPYTNGTYVQH